MEVFSCQLINTPEDKHEVKKMLKNLLTVVFVTVIGVACAPTPDPDLAIDYDRLEAFDYGSEGEDVTWHCYHAYDRDRDFSVKARNVETLDPGQGFPLQIVLQTETRGEIVVSELEIQNYGCRKK